jgi:hypothetical protein
MGRRPRLEVAGVCATGALHPVFVEVLHFRAAFIAAALIGWGAYVAICVRRRPSLLGEWGFTRRGLVGASCASGLVAACGLAGMAGYAAFRGSLAWHPHMPPLLLLYPIWGLAQQFLVQGLVVRNLAVGEHPTVPPAAATLLAAVLFGVVHLPDLTLTCMTFALALAFTHIHLRWRNLWPLGVFHGWLGAAAYFWVLGRDPWAEIIAGLT